MIGYISQQVFFIQQIIESDFVHLNCLISQEVILSKVSSQKLTFIDIKYKRKQKKHKYILFYKILDSNLPCRKPPAWIALKLFEHSKYLCNDNVSKILLLFVYR